jgi:predicted dehydrogenase
MIGLDTSHCAVFIELLNDENNPYYIKGAEVVIAYPGGSQEFSFSKNRVDKITSEVRDKFKIEVVDSIEEAAKKVDGVLMTSVDGRQHLEQFEKIAPFEKPVFIDKPFTTNVEEAKRIFELSKKFNSPVYSCSSLRYAQGIKELGQDKKVLGGEAFGPMAILDDFPVFFWYGIHSAEILFSKMGKGCREVTVRHTKKADTITGIWEDGRIGTVYGYRLPKLYDFGCTIFTEGGAFYATAGSNPPYYVIMMKEIIKFFQTGKSPIDSNETLEIMAFLEAANKSRKTGENIKLNI